MLPVKPPPQRKQVVGSSQRSNKMQEILNFLKNCGTYYLATSENGQPRVRPFGTIDFFDGKLTIQTGKSKEVSKQIHTNPKIEICAFNGSEWIRIEAIAKEDARIEAQSHMLDAYPSLKAMYRAGDGNTEIFALESGKATISSFTAPPRIILL